MVKNVVCLTEMPVVSLRQDIYVITEGSHLTIPCEFTGAPISNVTWERRNDIIRWSHRQSESLNLTLRNISRDMAGNYTCSVAVDYERTYTDSKTLTLVVKCKKKKLKNQNKYFRIILNYVHCMIRGVRVRLINAKYVLTLVVKCKKKK